jgi:hypothetical protein
MFATLFKNRSSAKRQLSRTKRRKPHGSPRLLVEALEARELLSAAPFLYTKIAGNPGHTPATAQAVPLAPMMESQVVRSDWGTGTHDFYKVQLTAGEIFIASDHATGPNGVAIPNTLALTDSTGKVLTSANNLTTSGDPAIAYRVSQTGTYDVEFSTTTAGSTSKYAYTLNLHPIGLNSAMEDPTWLNKTGGELDAWLSGNTLDFSGPAGHGFGIRGNWKQTVSGTGSSISSTYTDTGTMFLESAFGEIPIPATTFTVTTKAGPWGQYYGALGAMTGTSDLSLNDLAQPFESGSIFGLGLTTTLPEAKWGIKLGSQLASTGDPVEAAIPYLYFSFKSEVTVNFGGTQVSLNYPGLHGSGPALSVVADPTDSLFLSAQNIPGPVPNLALGFSEHGLIPFKPAATPDHFTENIYGQVYFGGTLDLTDTGVPVSIDGAFTANLDPNHTGKVLGGAFSNVSSFAAAMLPGAANGNTTLLADIDKALHNVTFGENGTLNLSFNPDNWIANLQIPVAKETVIFDGPSQKLYLHGTVVNPLQNTPLAQFIQVGANEDGYFSRNDGQFDVGLNGTVGLFGAQAQAAVDISNSGATIQADASYLGVNVDLKGALQTNGSFLLSAQAGVNFYIASATATFTLEGNDTQGDSFLVAATVDVLGNNAQLSGSIGPDGTATLTAHVGANFYVAGGSADLTFISGITGTSLYVSGHLDVLGATVNVLGYVDANGNYDLTGSTGVNFYIGNATANFALSGHLLNASLAVNGDVDVLGNWVYLGGSVQTNGTFSLSGHLAANFYFAGGSADILFSNTSGTTTFYIDGHLSLLGVNFDVTGYVDANANYDLTGQVGFNFYIASATANFSLAGHGLNAGLAVGADVNVLGNGVNFYGSIQTNGNFTITASLSANFYLANGSANFIFSNANGNVNFSIDAHANVLGANIELTGYVHSNGDFGLSAEAGLNLVNLVNVSAGFSLSRTSGALTFTAHVDGSVQLAVIEGTLDAYLSIGVDASGNAVYSGYGTASLEVYAPLYGWEVWNWQWQTIASVSVGVSNSDMWFTVDALGVNVTVTIGLPH